MIILHRIIPVFITALVLGVLLGLIVSYPIMILWNNCLVGAIEGANEIGWLQAWGLSLLSGFLFKSRLSTKE
jgi:hypothetical protein